MRESRFPPIALLLILIAAIAIYGVILLPGYTFAGMDFLNLSYPRALNAQDAFTNGKIPLWNWYEWGGAPLLATLLGSVLYPPTWLAMALPLPYGLHLFIFVHLLGAGIGTWFVARKVFRLQPLPAAYAAIAYMGNAFFIGRIEQFQVVAVNCLLPWLLLTAWQSMTGRRTHLSLSVVWAILLLAGHPQFAVLGLLGTGLFVLTARIIYTAGNSRVQWQNLARQLLRTALLIALGTALAAVQLLPTWELGQLSERIWPYPHPTSPELSWEHLPALLIPRYYNIITSQPGLVFGYTELGLYAGILTAPLSILAVIMAIRKRKNVPCPSTPHGALVVSAGITWLIAMWFALGSHGYIATLIHEHAPFFKQSRGAARSLNVASLMLALLAATGLNSLKKRDNSVPPLNNQPQSQGGSGVPPLKIPAQQTNSDPTAPTPNHPHTIRTLPTSLTMLALIITTIDLATNHHPALRTTLVPLAYTQIKPLIPDQIADQTRHSHSRIYRFMAFDSDLYLNNQPAAVSERNFRLQPNLNSIPGLAITDGYEEGLLPLRSHANLHRKFNRNLRSPSPDATLLAMLGAQYMITEYAIPETNNTWAPASPPLFRPAVVPQLTPNAPPTYTWWKSAYTPELLLSADKLTAAGIDINTMLTRASHDFPLYTKQRTPTSTEYRPHAFSDITPAFHADAAASFSAHNRHWNAITAQLTHPTSTALLLLSPYPGWKLSEKIEPAANIKPLNSIMYAIDFEDQLSVPASITLTFTPFSFRLGLFISLAATALTLALLLNYHIKGNALPWDKNNVNTPA